MNFDLISLYGFRCWTRERTSSVRSTDSIFWGIYAVRKLQILRYTCTQIPEYTGETHFLSVTLSVRDIVCQGHCLSDTFSVRYIFNTKKNLQGLVAVISLDWSFNCLFSDERLNNFNMTGKNNICYSCCKRFQQGACVKKLDKLCYWQPSAACWIILRLI